MSNQSGALTLDFIFALVLVLSMTFLLGLFSFTLSVVEGIQYLTYSSSRAYFASHMSEQHQRQAAQRKFNELSATGSYKKLLKKDWFSISIDNIGDNKREYGAEDSLDIFIGVRAKVVANILSQSIPLFGSTEGDTPFVTYTTSFIGREPSMEECMNVVNERFTMLVHQGGYTLPTPEIKYERFDDNGC
jgi:hypothetical protein